MTTKAIRQKLVNYLQVADDKKIKAIYTMVEDEIESSASDWDENFIKDLEDRRESFANGNDKTFSWEETKTAAIDLLKAKRK